MVYRKLTPPPMADLRGEDDDDHNQDQQLEDLPPPRVLARCAHAVLHLEVRLAHGARQAGVAVAAGRGVGGVLGGLGVEAPAWASVFAVALEYCVDRLAISVGVDHQYETWVHREHGPARAFLPAIFDGSHTYQLVARFTFDRRPQPFDLGWLEVLTMA